MLIPPAYRVLATVAWSGRYAEERKWTVMLAARHDLLNISFGAAPLRRGPLSAEHKRKIAATKRLRGGATPSAAAA
jgi:hypothetical protein